MGMYGNNNPKPYSEIYGKTEEWNLPQYPMPTSGMCIAGFVCSLVLVGILGLIFSIIGIKECNEQGYNGKGLGIAGLIVSIVKLAIIVLWLSCFGFTCISFMPNKLW